MSISRKAKVSTHGRFGCGRIYPRECEIVSRRFDIFNPRPLGCHWCIDLLFHHCYDYCCHVPASRRFLSRWRHGPSRSQICWCVSNCKGEKIPIGFEETFWSAASGERHHNHLFCTFGRFRLHQSFLWFSTGSPCAERARSSTGRAFAESLLSTTTAIKRESLWHMFFAGVFYLLLV